MIRFIVSWFALGVGTLLAAEPATVRLELLTLKTIREVVVSAGKVPVDCVLISFGALPDSQIQFVKLEPAAPFHLKLEGARLIQMGASHSSKIQVQKLMILARPGRPVQISIGLPSGPSLEVEFPISFAKAEPSFLPGIAAGDRMEQRGAHRITLLGEVPFNDYLSNVVEQEIGYDAPLEARKAQAILARTFAERAFQYRRHVGFDLCSSTHCQVYRLAAHPSRATQDAVESTRSFHLGFQNQLAEIFFHANCGGETALPLTELGYRIPYLDSKNDRFCARSPSRQWLEVITAADLKRALSQDERTHPGALLNGLEVRQRDRTGRIEQIAILGSRERLVDGGTFRLVVGKALGWQRLKSTRFEVEKVLQGYRFYGAGLGHGLGLCQDGAREMARRGMSYTSILNFYFPGTRLLTESPFHTAALINPVSRALRNQPGVLSQQETQAALGAPLQPLKREPSSLRKGWASKGRAFRWRPPERPLAGPVRYQKQSEHVLVEFFRSEDEESAHDILKLLEGLRANYIKLERPVPSTSIKVTLHPTTMDFMAATSKPNFIAGTTTHNAIALQPVTFLKRRGVFESTLRHEFAHVCINTLRHIETPVWLQEGFAVYLSGENKDGPSKTTPKQYTEEDQLDVKFTSPNHADELSAAYRFAFEKVRALIRRNRGEKFVWDLIRTGEDAW